MQLLSSFQCQMPSKTGCPILKVLLQNHKYFMLLGTVTLQHFCWHFSDYSSFETTYKVELRENELFLEKRRAGTTN